jgi:hypothetical protein
MDIHRLLRTRYQVCGLALYQKERGARPSGRQATEYLLTT